MVTTLNHQGVRLGRQSSGWGFPPPPQSGFGTRRAVALWGSGLYNLVLLAASYWGTGPSSTNAAFALRPSALRGASGGAGACL
jgi:hypothetical protein